MFTISVHCTSGCYWFKDIPENEIIIMDKKEILLISESLVKSETTLDLNVAGNYLQQAIKAAQDLDVEPVIGTSLLNKFKELIADNDIRLDENYEYEYLLNEYIHPFLCYSVLEEICIPISYKIANAGVSRVDDEKLSSSQRQDVVLLKDYYCKKADEYKRRLQKYLCCHKAEFPELKDCGCCTGVKPNLNSAADTGLWLGGPYGRRL